MPCGCLPFVHVHSPPQPVYIPIAVITQVGQRPCLVFNFALRGLNKATKHLALMEAIHSYRALHCILKQVISSDLRLVPVYISKVNLDDAYMVLWLRI